MTETTTGKSLLLSAKQAAELLAISKTSFYALRSADRMIAPVRLGRSVRFHRDELEQWVLAGCPMRERWELLKKGGRR